MEIKYSTITLAKVVSTGEVFRCFPDFGCYDMESKLQAVKDAEKAEDRIIY